MRKLRAIKILTDFAEAELYLCSSSAAEPYRRAIAELEQLQAEIEQLKQTLEECASQKYCTMCGKVLDGYKPKENKK